MIIGGPDETEECENIRRLAGDTRVLNLCGQTKPMHIPLICSQAKCIVGNDTGTAHLAAAALRPMVVVCGPTDPRRVRPAGDHVITVQLDIPCKNCYAKTCAHHSCMNLLKVDTVIDALLHVRRGLNNAARVSSVLVPLVEDEITHLCQIARVHITLRTLKRRRMCLRTKQ